jgi:hypothetical protein
LGSKLEARDKDEERYLSFPLWAGLEPPAKPMPMQLDVSSRGEPKLRCGLLLA